MIPAGCALILAAGFGLIYWWTSGDDTPIGDIARSEAIARADAYRMHPSNTAAFSDDTENAIEQALNIDDQHIVVEEWVWHPSLGRVRRTFIDEHPAVAAERMLRGEMA